MSHSRFIPAAGQKVRVRRRLATALDELDRVERLVADTGIEILTELERVDIGAIRNRLERIESRLHRELDS